MSSQKELYHHGILGQKWGIRRFQNKDGSLTEAGEERYKNEDQIVPKDANVVSKGTVFQRISTVQEKKPIGDRMYVSYKSSDNDWYTEHMTDFRGGVSKMFKVSYEAVRDIYYPSHKKQVDTFLELYKDKPIETSREISKELADRSAKSFLQMNPQYQTLGKQIVDYYLKEYSSDFKKFEKETEKLRTEGYKYFMMAYSDTPNIRTKYQKRLIKEGYNAIIDDNDVRYNDAFSGRPTDSLIVFEPQKNLKNNGAKKLSQKEYDDAKARNKKRYG